MRTVMSHLRCAPAACGGAALLLVLCLGSANFGQAAAQAPATLDAAAQLPDYSNHARALRLPD